MSTIESVPARTPRAALGAWMVPAWIVLLCAAYAKALQHMWGRWFPAWKRTHYSLYDRLTEGESYYTHGPLVPLVSLLIVWLLIRHTKITRKPARLAGGIVLALGLLMHLAASLARVAFASGFSMIVVLAGLVLIWWGFAALRRFWFPLVFLAFMVPLPEVTIANWNFALKMYAANVGVQGVNLLGRIAVRSGNTVFLEGDRQLVVANVCNGLRTIISLLAFGALYAYVCKLKGAWRWLLFAMSFPVAIIANSIRITLLILVADLVSVDAATGFFHDFSGLLIFVLAFLLMFGIERGILGLRKLVGKPASIEPLFAGRLRDENDRTQGPEMVAALASTRSFVAMGVVALAGCGAWFLNTTGPAAMNQEEIAQAIPADLVVDGVPMVGEWVPLDENTLTILEDPSFISRRYFAGPRRPSIFLSVIFSRDNRKGVHPPDLCLEGAGQSISLREDLTAPPMPGHDELPVRGLVVSAGGLETYFLYTYKCGGRYTRSFWTQQATIFANGLLDRNAAGALIRVSTPVQGNDLDAARQRCFAMFQAIMPYLDENLP